MTITSTCILTWPVEVCVDGWLVLEADVSVTVEASVGVTVEEPLVVACDCALEVVAVEMVDVLEDAFASVVVVSVCFVAFVDVGVIPDESFE